jgi:hypothetical protein
MTVKTLDELAEIDTDETFDLPLPLTVTFTLTEHTSPGAFKNLATLKRLGIDLGEALMSVLAVAPVDPINLARTLLQHDPSTWKFAPHDCAFVRVLARAPDKSVAAALRVDLIGGDLVTLVQNRARQLTMYETLAIEPGPDVEKKIQALCDRAVAAAARESKPPVTSKGSET